MLALYGIPLTAANGGGGSGGSGGAAGGGTGGGSGGSTNPGPIELPPAMRDLIDGLRGVSGTYRFPDATDPGRIYTGRANDLAGRLLDHIDQTGKLNPNDAGTVGIIRNDPFAENTMIDFMGGPKSVNPDTNASNKIWGKGANKWPR